MWFVGLTHTSREFEKNLKSSASWWCIAVQMNRKVRRKTCNPILCIYRGVCASSSSPTFDLQVIMTQGRSCRRHRRAQPERSWYSTARPFGCLTSERNLTARAACVRALSSTPGLASWHGGITGEWRCSNVSGYSSWAESWALPALLPLA